MMFIDYITLMLINASAGLFVLACYLYWGLDDADQVRWSPAFLVPGFVAVTTGLHMIFTWPLPGPFNSAFGEMNVLFGVLLAGAGLALWKSWSLLPVAIYGLFAGLAAVVFGVRFISLSLTQTPTLTGVAFILAGLGGLFALPVLFWRKNRPIRIAGVATMAVAAAMLALIGYGGIWMHMQAFHKWMPYTMR